MQSEASFTPRYCTGDRISATRIFTTASAVKPTKRDDKEEAVPCDDEESVLPHHQDQTPYPVVFQDALQERRDDTMESRGVIVSGEEEIKIQGMKMEQQKQQKASEKTYEINTK